MSMYVHVVCMYVYEYGIIAPEQVRAGTPAYPEGTATGSIAAESRTGPTGRATKSKESKSAKAKRSEHQGLGLTELVSVLHEIARPDEPCLRHLCHEHAHDFSAPLT